MRKGCVRTHVVSPGSPLSARLWRERVVKAVAQTVADLEHGPLDRTVDAQEVGHAVQAVLFRLIGRMQAEARGLARDGLHGVGLRKAVVRSRADDVRRRLSELDVETRTSVPWSPGESWFEEETMCPVEAWPPEAAARLVDAVLSTNDGPVEPHAGALPVQEIGRLYESLLVLHDGSAPAGRRRGSGSYYTPDPIVSHITGRACACLAGDRTPAVLLSLRVLDPAMGAGHFLLEALALLSDALARAERRSGGSSAVPSCAPAAEPDVQRRWLVADACLYGVDRDRRAVDLTRLLVWLAIGHGGPLPPGLLRHLRVGNSLVGCAVEDLSSLPGGEQMVRRGHQVRAELRRRRDGGPLPADYGSVSTACDLRTSLWVERPPDSATPRSVVNRARRLARENQFFHWDLAFPEVFCDSRGRWRKDGGFDLIIGNPPYAVDTRPCRAALRNGHYTTTAKTDHRPASLNSAAIFIDRAHQLLRRGGALGFIVPNSILRVGQYARVRDLLTEQYTIHEVVDEGAPFRAANLEMVSLIAERNPAPPEHRVLVRDGRRGEDHVDGYVEQRTFRERGLIAIYVDDIVLTMERATARLGDITGNRRGLSISPGNLQSLDRRPSGGPWMLRGRNLSRYALIHLPGEDRFLRAAATGSLADDAAAVPEGKLLIQNIGSQIVAALSTGAEGFLETVNILSPVEGTGYGRTALLVLLNSRLMTYYFSRALINRSPLTVHLDGMYTGRFPLPDCSRPLRDRKLARRIADRLGEPLCSGEPAIHLLEEIGQHLTDLGRRWSETLAHGTDVLLGQIGWGTPTAALDLLRRDLWIIPTAQFLEELHKRDGTAQRWNARTLGSVRKLHRRVSAELRAVGTPMGRPPFPHEGSLDALADALVYRLYGLSAEQIGRVERAAVR